MPIRKEEVEKVVAAAPKNKKGQIRYKTFIEFLEVSQGVGWEGFDPVGQTPLGEETYSC